MSYKSWKRRDQRRRSIARVTQWKDFRKEEADKAFKEWKLIHVDGIRKEYFASSN